MSNCFHCGDPIVHPVKQDEKTFCCQGCLSVYNIISNAGLDKYYDGEEQAGLNTSKKSLYLDFLDAEEVEGKLLSYKDNERSVVKFILPSIHCASCVWLLERLSALNPGIISSEIDFLSKRITIHFNHNTISLRQVGELLMNIGYEPKLDLEQRKRKINHLIIRIGVAGFAFGNIMLLSFPEYLGETTGGFWKGFFSLISVVLSIPLLTYCAYPFYRGVITAARSKRVSVDILIVLGIAALFFRSSYDIFILEGSGYLDSLGGLIFFLLMGKWFQAKVFSELSFEKSNSSYLPLAVLKQADKDFEVTPLNKVVKGDVIRLRNGEVVPFKSIIKSSDGVVENSFITGEELPISVKSGDIVYCGAQVRGEFIDLVVLDTKEDDLSDLWREQQRSSDESAHWLQNKVIPIFTYTIILIAITTFTYWWINSGVEKAFLAATSVLIIACPCAVALSGPTVFGITLRRFSKKGLFLKGAEVIKKLEGIKSIVFDKTGTITGKGMELSWVGEALTARQKAIISAIIENSSHPFASKIRNALAVPLNDDVVLGFFNEDLGLGVTAVAEGVEYKIGSADFVDCSAGSETSVYFKIDNEIVGHYEIRLSLRADIDKVFQNIRSNSIGTYILSGDPHLNVSSYSHLTAKDHIIKGASPTDKRKFIELQNQKDSVLMIGDGINDSLAFDAADVGIAVVEETGAFFPSCDGILKAEHFKELPFFIAGAKYSKQVLVACFTFSFLYNAVGLYFAVTNQLTPLFAAILMPLSSATIVVLASLLLRKL